jgi:hypothetical protein
MPLLIRENRAFLGRAVGYLAREAGTALAYEPGRARDPTYCLFAS